MFISVLYLFYYLRFFFFFQAAMFIKTRMDYVAFGSDGWASTKHQNVIAYTAAYAGVALVWDFEHIDGPHDNINLGRRLQQYLFLIFHVSNSLTCCDHSQLDSIHDGCLRKDLVVSFSHDNASVMRLTGSRLEKRKENVQCLPS